MRRLTLASKFGGLMGWLPQNGLLSLPASQLKEPQGGKINFLGRTKILIQNRILYLGKLFKKKNNEEEKIFLKLETKMKV